DIAFFDNTCGKRICQCFHDIRNIQQIYITLCLLYLLDNEQKYIIMFASITINYVETKFNQVER
ncbi:MAG: hypothetical protein KAI26_08480, partial [Nanoarchaeota archaeon]|nr:hypothetical protein [Nanoarchaeota archaeon]